MNAYSDELRLLWVVLLNGGVFASAYCFARRRGAGGALQAICDAFLLYFLTQYVAIGLPGLFGGFTACTMSLAALIATVAMVLGSGMGGPPMSFESKPTGEPPAPQSTWTLDHLGLIACALFAGGYLAAYAWSLRLIPPVATDAIVYHLPIAVQWIQTHRLGIYPTWYWNPAASYSPGTGSIFMSWWIAPAGNDLFVRFVQLPPLMFIFFLVARMCRLLGCTRTVAGLIAVGATLSRPLFSEAIFPKDDLYVTGFIAAGVLSLTLDARFVVTSGLTGPGRRAGTARHERERRAVPALHETSRNAGEAESVVAQSCLSPWRVGVAIGFVLASKYTALLACPIFLFLMDSPFRARWRLRHWTIAIGIVLAMVLPWYVRNIILTGNPLYPVDVHLPGLTLHGLFGTERDQQLRAASGIWHMLSDTYHSLPTPLIVLLLAGWVWACIVGGRSILRDPLPRACVLGSVVTLILFLTTSPHHEVRYIFPLIVLWFVAVGFGLARITRLCLETVTPVSEVLRRAGSAGEKSGSSEYLRDRRLFRLPGFGKDPGILDYAEPKKRKPWCLSLVPPLIALIVAVISTMTTFSADLIVPIAQFGGTALLIALVGAGAVFLQMRVLRLSRKHVAMFGAFAILGIALAAYVQWHAYVFAYQEARFVAWGDADNGYPRQAPIWKWVDENVPADGTIAYANTFFVYPYYGFGLSRHVGYAPVRQGLHDFRDFPRMGDRLPGDLIVRRMTEVMNENPDRDTWLENLRAMKAGYLVVMKPDPGNPDLSADPPELRFAREKPGIFVPSVETEAGIVFRIERR